MDFVVRRGDRLYLGEKEFRFISFNIPDALYSSYADIPTLFPTPAYEQEDLIRGLSRIGCTVARLYCLSIPGEGVNIPPWNCFVQKPGELYSEDYFLAFDKLLEICGRYGMRLIFPFVDRYKYIGGVGDYAACRGREDDAFSPGFYTDPRVIQDFKDVITKVLTRVNAYTGVAYRDDPAILAWETGNELYHDTLYDGWAAEIAAHIKSVDQNHLVLDGFYGVRGPALTDPNIDIVSTHMYPFHAPDFIKEADTWYNVAAGKKPFIVGEFGFKTVAELEPFLQHVVDSPVTGALVWSLRQHSVYGGIRHHRENETYCTYHIPGYAENDVYEEKALVSLISRMSHRINGTQAAACQPDPPFLLPIHSAENIRFLGSTGAEKYILERMTDKAEGFSVVRRDITDGAPEGAPYCADPDGKGVRYYRVRAVSGSRISAPSNIQRFDGGD